MPNYDAQIFITTNSRDVQPGSIFVAIRGQKFDGHNFVEDAVNHGAAVIIVEDKANVPPNFKGTVEVVSDTRQRLAELAQNKFQNPSKNLFSVGITGTNGKTSVSFLTEHFLNEKNCPTGVIGTVDHHLKAKNLAHRNDNARTDRTAKSFGGICCRRSQRFKH